MNRWSIGDGYSPFDGHHRRGTELESVASIPAGREREHRLRNRWDEFDQFRAYCDEHDTPFQFTQPFERVHPRAAGQCGLTVKRHEALVTA